MNKKVLILRAKTPEQLSEEINRIKEDTIATQIFQDKVSSDWIAFCWYEPKLENEKKPDYTKPSEAQLFRIRDLKKKGIIKEFVDYNALTKSQATKLLSKYLPPK